MYYEFVRIMFHADRYFKFYGDGHITPITIGIEISEVNDDGEKVTFNFGSAVFPLKISIPHESPNWEEIAELFMYCHLSEPGCECGDFKYIIQDVYYRWLVESEWERRKVKHQQRMELARARHT